VEIQTSESFTWNKFALVMVFALVIGCVALGFAITGKFRDSVEGKANALVIEQIGAQATAQALEIERQEAQLELGHTAQALEQRARLTQVLTACGIILAIALTVCLVIGLAVFTYGWIEFVIEKGRRNRERIPVLNTHPKLERAGESSPELPAKVQPAPRPAAAANGRMAETEPDRPIPVGRVDSEAVSIPVSQRHSDRSRP
jgi:multisubunit Na+/H+ antiporter MnhC subunit